MHFHWNAAYYNQHSQFQYAHAEEVLSSYAFQSSEHVLDVGCGDGKITHTIASQVPEGTVIGIDNSESMIQYATNKFNDCPNLFFKVCDAEKIDYHHQFDLIVSFACLHWVRDQLAFLIGAKNALKADGRMILDLYPKHPLIWGAIEDTVHHKKWSKYFVDYSNPHISYDLPTYESLAKKSGLNIISIKEQIPTAEFTSRDHAEAFVRSWLPHTEQLSSPLKSSFISDIFERFLENAPSSPDNRIGIPFRRLNIILQK